MKPGTITDISEITAACAALLAIASFGIGLSSNDWRFATIVALLWAVIAIGAFAFGRWRRSTR